MQLCFLTELISQIEHSPTLCYEGLLKFKESLLESASIQVRGSVQWESRVSLRHCVDFQLLRVYYKEAGESWRDGQSYARAFAARVEDTVF